MCRFARDCIVEMRKVVHDLSSTLGADTMDLNMRIGIHSGETTAGVLRGDRGRFQLFGDTVNTGKSLWTTSMKTIPMPCIFLIPRTRSLANGKHRTKRKDSMFGRYSRLATSGWQDPLAHSSRRQNCGERIRRDGNVLGECHFGRLDIVWAICRSCRIAQAIFLQRTAPPKPGGLN